MTAVAFVVTFAPDLYRHSSHTFDDDFYKNMRLS